MPILRGMSRVVVPEWMDEPELEVDAHAGALAGLKRINLVSGAAGQVARPIVNLARQRGLTRVSVMDVACGGGDVAAGVAAAARRAGVTVELVLVDVSVTALEMASTAAERAGTPRRTIRADVREGLAVEGVDVVMSSLFVHHLRGRADAVAALAAMRRAARRMVVVSDLRRSLTGWAVAWAGCRALSRSAIVHHDGPASVRAAWTMAELRQMAAEAGMGEATVAAAWPWRMRLVWERNDGN